MGAAPTRGPFSSARAHSTTCKLRPATPSRRVVSRGLLSLERRRSTRARHSHAPCRGGSGRHRFVERCYAGQGPRSFGTHPLCDVSAAVFSTKPAPRVTQRRRTCTSCLWGGGAAREVVTQARRGALVVLGTHFVKGRRAGERNLSFGMRMWCNVPAAVFNTKPAPRVTQRRRTCALCLWGGGVAA